MPPTPFAPIATIAAVLGALLGVLGVSAAQAVPGGEIGTLPPGRYVCELPGDASGPASIRVESEQFTIVAPSSYHARGKRGSYLMTGDEVVMTSGPFDGKRYRRISAGFLKALDAGGGESQLRCVLTGGSRM